MRCVKAWSMAVPWTGFPISALIKEVDPKPDARYVRMVTAHRPNEMPGITSQSHYPWPYFEALRLDEAMNELALFVTGIYGKPLPKQNGAPIRLTAKPARIVGLEFGHIGVLGPPFRSTRSVRRVNRQVE